MIITCSYKTPRELCKAILPFAEKVPGKLTKRPRNRFNPDYTSWWLVPDTKNPHFKFGKYYFDWGDKKHISLAAGFYIEKGLDEKLAPVYSSKKAKSLIMASDWSWFGFVERLKNKQIFNNLKETCPSLLETQFITEGGYVTEPTSFDPYQERNLGWDKYVFTWKPDSEDMHLVSADRNAYILKMHNVKTTEDYISAISDYSANEWLWMNIYIAVKLEINKLSATLDNTWNAENLWGNFLRVFSSDFLRG